MRRRLHPKRGYQEWSHIWPAHRLSYLSFFSCVEELKGERSKLELGGYHRCVQDFGISLTISRSNYISFENRGPPYSRAVHINQYIKAFSPLGISISNWVFYHFGNAEFWKYCVFFIAYGVLPALGSE